MQASAWGMPEPAPGLSQRCYQCERQGDALVIRNPEGRELRCQWPQTPGDNPDPVQSHPDTAELVQHAALALGFVA